MVADYLRAFRAARRLGLRHRRLWLAWARWRPSRSARCSPRRSPTRPSWTCEDRTGTGDHFQVTVASARFDGLPLIEQHRLVNDALAAPLADGTIHELRIKTKGTA